MIKNFFRATIMGKPVTFSTRIDEDVLLQFNKLHHILGGKKYETLSAAIEAFSVLPRAAQRTLQGNDQSEKERILAVLARIRVPATLIQAAKKAKSAKSG